MASCWRSALVTAPSDGLVKMAVARSHHVRGGCRSSKAQCNVLLRRKRFFTGFFTSPALIRWITFFKKCACSSLSGRNEHAPSQTYPIRDWLAAAQVKRARSSTSPSICAVSSVGGAPDADGHCRSIFESLGTPRDSFCIIYYTLFARHLVNTARGRLLPATSL